MRCPFCGEDKTKVIETTRDARGNTRRRRQCKKCSNRFSTVERAVLATPMLVKRDGRREEFDRDKLTRNIRIACAKRKVTGDDIERLVNEVEAQLQSLGKPEVDSRTVGDMIVSRLKKLDKIAYIRFATVYFEFDDLESVKGEIDRLLTN